jgi:light-regulated signal transduction histidine kinase (bacteriophytochrome)
VTANWNEHRAVLVTIADVTDRHLADRELRRENAELEEALQLTRAELDNTNRDLAAFTYALSNDLQGPLHAANGYASILLDKYAAPLEGPGQHYISRIQASTRQLAGLVDDLRCLVQLPQASAAPDTFDIKRICETLIEELRSRDPGRAVTVEVVSGLMLSADRALVTIALRALLDNAWKFTSTRPEGWVRVRLLPGADPEERILQVSDNGTGFDAAYADTLFIAFKRLHSAAAFPGNGLGLAIVKRVADRHGGTAWGETTDTGATFSMSFPRRSADQTVLSH